MAGHITELPAGPAAATWKPRSTTERREPRWDLAFLGVLLYIVVEYTRLPAMFPVLAVFQVAKISAGLGLVGMLFSSRIRGKGGDAAAVSIAIGVFTLSTLASVLMAPDLLGAWNGFLDMARWAVVFFLLSRVVANRWRMRVLLILLILLNVKLAQFQLRTYQAELEWGRSEEYLARGVGAGSTGFFANSNDFGIAMAVIWPLAGMAAFAEKNKLLKLVLFGGFLIISASILFSASRGALVGAAAAAGFAWLTNPKRLVGPLLLALLVGGAMFLLPGAHQERIRSMFEYEDDANAQTRITLWRAGWRMFQDNPVLGVGINNYSEASHSYGVRSQFVPHSIYVQSLSELGLVGTIPLLVLLFLILRLNWRTGKRLASSGPSGHRAYEYYIAHGLNFSLVAFMTNGAFLTVLYYPHLWILAGLSVGLHTAAPEVVQQETAPKRSRMTPAQAHWDKIRHG